MERSFEKMKSWRRHEFCCGFLAQPVWNAAWRKQHRMNINRLLRHVAGLVRRRIALPALAILLPPIFFATSLLAQPTFDIGGSEIAIENVSGSPITVDFKAAGLIFDEDLALTHRYAEFDYYPPQLDDGLAWGLDGPWSWDAAAGDIDEVVDTIGAGEYEFNIHGTIFYLNLIDAQWGAGSNTSVYKILIRYDGDVHLHVRTPGSSGTWSSGITVTGNERYTYWGLIQATHDASYARERTGHNNLAFHVTGDDNLLPLPSTGVLDAVLDVNLSVQVDIGVPQNSVLRINGFDEAPRSTELRFAGGTGLTVEGELHTVEPRYLNEYVRFVSDAASPSAGDWRGITCASAPRIRLHRIYIAHAERGLDLQGCPDVRGDNVSVAYCMLDGVRIDGSLAYLEDFNSSMNHENGLYVTNSEVHVRDGHFGNSAHQGGVVVGDGSFFRYLGGRAYANRTNGLFAYGGSRVIMDSVQVYGNGFVQGEDWSGVYSFYNDDPLTLRHSQVWEQSTGLMVVWAWADGYETPSYPVTWYNADSLALNCIHTHDYNLLGHYGHFELGRAYYNGTVPHYQGGESSIFNPVVLQGLFEYSEAWLQRDFWDGNTVFDVQNSMVETSDALWTDHAGCGLEGGPGGDRSATYNQQSLALYQSWDSLTVSSLQQVLYQTRGSLSALDAAAGLRRVWQRADASTAESYMQRMIANSTRPEILLPAYRYLAAARIKDGDWNSAAQAFLAMPPLSGYGSWGYTSAQAMAALALHHAGATPAARAHLDSLLLAHPGDRDLVLVHRLIGGGASPKQPVSPAADQRNTSTHAEGFALHAARPNPFHTGTTVSFTLPEATTVRVAVHDLAGREVARLADGRYSAGRTELHFDAGDLPAGVYLLRLVAGEVHLGRTLHLLR